ncbi:hypothetical protein ACMGDM_14695 [Sphingomonas sp. DT-51]|uniref:hypothetical protein n=1 Tax=Sphingomonas sp. DT-51 TaxID=3396165 RepID=UPI003F1C8E6C
MVDMTVGSEITVASDPAVIAFSNHKYPADRLFNIAFGVWLGWTSNSYLLRRIVADCRVVHRHMK